jgi:hypothetical protein
MKFVLSIFILKISIAKVYLLILETFVGSFLSSCLATVRLKNNNSSEPVQCVIQKRTPHNKRKQKLNCVKEKKRGKVQICTEKRI